MKMYIHSEILIFTTVHHSRVYHVHAKVWHNMDRKKKKKKNSRHQVVSRHRILLMPIMNLSYVKKKKKKQVVVVVVVVVDRSIEYVVVFLYGFHASFVIESYILSFEFVVSLDSC